MNEQKMNAEVKAAWVAALRSGEYRQGRGALRQAGQDGIPRFCVLGVLCDLHSAETGRPWENSKDDGFTYDNLQGLVSSDVQSWAGHARLNNARLQSDDHSYQIADWNDGIELSVPLSFTALADLIEAQL